jgi:RNA polymerase sigma-70 factor (ECF subfamily)
MTDESPGRSLRTASPADDADRRILAELGAGRLEALETLYDRYRAMAFAIALRITADPGLAEDVVQDAFLGAWRHADRYVEGRGSVKTWLLSIVHHRAIDAVRRRRPAVELPDPDLPPPPQLIAADVWPEVAGRIDAVEIRAALASLSGVQREALELAYFGGLSQTEIAERTATPLGTVKSRMRLGLLALRRELVGAGDSMPGLASDGWAP